jgi:hypothetical protein
MIRGVPAGRSTSAFGVCQIAGKLTSFGYVSVSTNPDRQVKWLSKLLIGATKRVDQPGAVFTIHGLTNFRGGAGNPGADLSPNCRIS